MSETKSLVEFIESDATVDPRRPVMVMATSFLIEATMAALKGDASLDPGFTLNHEIDATLLWKWDSHLWKLLRNDGWCPSELAAIFSRSNASSLWFLHHLTRPASHRRHQMIHIRDPTKIDQGCNPDNLCTASSCVYRRLRDETYVTQHTASCEDCDEVVADLESLCSILSDNKIPLIVPIKEESTAPEISFCPADPDRAYIAISHVWSDGLGNPHRNALPRCQLVRLSNIALSYPSAPLFWLDTLCVPPDIANVPKEQKIALELMRKTYEDAEAVVVLDSWIVDAMSEDETDVESLHRIFYCGWNTRLWTFQEGALARTLLFQFKDRLYDVDKGIDRLKEKRSPSIDFTVKPVLIRLHSQLRGFRKAGGAINDQLRFISGSTAIRTTSVGADETLCLTALLDLDVGKVIDTKPELRMQQFWRMLPFIPSGFLFQPRYERMDIDGFRWAPRTLLGLNDSVHLDAPGLLNLKERGLCGAGVGLKFRSGDKNVATTLRLTDDRQKWYYLNFDLRNCLEAKMAQVFGECPIKRRTINIKQAYGCGEIGIVFDESLRGESQKDLTKDSSVPQGHTVALLAIKEEIEGCAYSRFICTGVIQEMESGVYDRDARVLKQAVEDNATKIKPEDVEDLDLRPDNMIQRLGGEGFDVGDVKKLAKLGVLSVKQAGGLFCDNRTGTVIVAPDTTCGFELGAGSSSSADPSDSSGPSQNAGAVVGGVIGGLII
ncbi:hypothetical protein FAUST_11958, partial [Fusarium austroamericanum]